MCGGPSAKCVLLALAFIVAGCGSREKLTSIPRIELSPKVIDLGNVTFAAGPTLDAQVRVANRGGAPLKFSALSSSCGCTIVQQPRPVLDPGQSNLIRITVRNTYEAGPRSSHITFHTNDINEPSVELRIRWNVVSIIETDPSSIDFGVLKQFETKVEAVSVKLAPSHETSRIKVQGSLKGVTWSWNADSKRSAPRVLTISVKSDAKEGEYAGSLTLEADGSDARTVLPIRWRAMRPLQVHPSALFSSRVEAGSTLEREVRVVSSAGSPFRIRRVHGGTGSDSAVLEMLPSSEEGKADQHIVRLRMKAPQRKGVHRVVVEVVTDLSPNEKISFPWSVLVE